jgi:hypothetical protein
LIFFEEQLTPGGADRHRGGERNRVAIRRIAQTSSGAQRAATASELGGIARPSHPHGHASQRRFGVTSAQHLEQQTELERGLARRRPLRNRAKPGLGLLIPAARDERAGLHRGDLWILGIKLRGKGGDLVVAPFDQRTRRLLQPRGSPPRRLRNEDGDDGEQNEQCRHAEGMDPAGRPKAKPPHRRKASGNTSHVVLII